MPAEKDAIRLYQALDFQDIEKLQQCAQALFARPVYLTDGNLNPFHVTDSDGICKPLLRHITAHLSPSQPSLVCEEEGNTYLAGAVYRQNLPVIFAVMAGSPGAFRQDETDLFLTLLDVLNLWLSAQSPRGMLYRRTTSTYINFLIDLLRGNFTGRADLERRERQLAFVPPDEFVVLIIDMENYASNLSMFFISDAITDLLSCPMFCFHEGKLIFLVDTVASPVWQRAEALEEILRSASLSAAYSLSCTDILQTQMAYMDAQKTLELGNRLKPDGWLYSASDYMIYSIIDNQADRLFITKYVNPLLLELQAYDQEHHTELLETLYTYLKHIKDPDAAAERLHIHRNTFFYRMRMIRKFMKGVSPDDGDVIMQLMLSYHIMYYKGMIGPLEE